MMKTCTHGPDALDFDGSCTACVRVFSEPAGGPPVLTITPETVSTAPAVVSIAKDAAEVQRQAVARAEVLGGQAAAIVIRNEAQYAESAALLKQIKAQAAAFDEQRKSMTRPLDEAKRRIMELFRPAETRLSQAELALKSASLRYLKEKAGQKEAEEKRLAALADEERARLMAAGREEEAGAIPVPVLAEPKSEVSGVSTREIWKAEVTDLEALIQAVADKRVPSICLLPDMKVLNEQARSLKGAWMWPGVKAVKEEMVVVRA